MGCSNEESMTMADLVCSINSNLVCFQSSLLPSQKGVSRARSDDTKSMTRKGAGLGVDWSDPEYISPSAKLDFDVTNFLNPEYERGLPAAN
jgi:hypothetical protein